MKKSLLLAFILLGQLAFAQKKVAPAPNVPLVNNEVVYEKDYDVASQSQAQLYSNSQAWFVQRYKSANDIDSKDDAAGKVNGSVVDYLTFKGPINRDVTCKLQFKIEISSREGAYKVRISNIVYGYQADPTDERVYFSAEDLSKYVTTGHKIKDDKGINPIPFNSKQSEKALASLTSTIDQILASLNETMKQK